MSEEKGTFETWTEEITVAGGDLYEKLQELLKDASVHRLRVINNRTKEVVFDIPVALGIGVVLLANIWAVIGAAMLYVADFQIVVEHRSEAGGSDADVAEAIVVHDAEDAAPADEPVVEKAAPAAETAPAEADRCAGTTKSGSQCKRKPMEGSAYCYAHQPV